MSFMERLQHLCFGLESDPDWMIKTWTSMGLLLAALVGAGLVYFHGGIVSTGMAAFAAAIGLGGVLGFLFGVPVSGSKATVDLLKSPKPGAPSQSANVRSVDPQLAANSAQQGTPVVNDTVTQSSGVSNLEQVADWITKLLLGGGLTQLGKIPPKVWQWSRMVALGIIGEDKNVTEQVIEAQQTFAAGVLIYGFILGFFGGFLITKLQLSKSISD